MDVFKEYSLKFIQIIVVTASLILFFFYTFSYSGVKDINLLKALEFFFFFQFSHFLNIS